MLKKGKEEKNNKKTKKEQVSEDELNRNIVRVGDLDDSVSDEELDAIVSAYMPLRRIKLLAKSLLRLDKVRLSLLLAILLVIILFITSFVQEKMGNFTINLDRLELYRKGIAIADNGDFTSPTARLAAAPIVDATNISISDLPGNIPDIDGDHNGTNYVAYTYYIRNAGKEDVSYVARVILEGSSKGAEDALRVAVWNDGVRTVYAKASADGTPEPGCVNFLSDKVVCEFREEDFLVGNVNKYSIAIWLEGDDPECVDRIVGGSVELSMKVASAGGDDTTLLQKYIRDIIDTLTGNKPINAAGVDAPNINYSDVTWDTRRNQ